MTKQRPMGEEDDSDLIVENDEQDHDPYIERLKEDDPPEPDLYGPEEEPGESDEPELEPHQRKQPKRSAKDDAEWRERKKQQAIKQRHALQEARRIADEKERELADLRAKYEELQSRTADSTIERIDREISRAEADLERAVDAGDAKGQVLANRALAKLEAERMLAERTQKPRKTADQGQQQTQQQQSMPLAKMPKHVLAWVGKNGMMSWSQEERQLAMRIGSELQDEGFDDTEPDFLVELEDRLKEFLPHRFGSPQAGQRQNGGAAYDLRRSAKSQPSPASEERPNRPQTGERRTPTAQDMQLIRRMYGTNEPSQKQIAAYLRANQTPLARRVER